MFEQTLPGVPDAIEDARNWTRTVVRRDDPELADRASNVAALLVASSIPRTGDDGVIRLTVERTKDGLAVEVLDPGGEATEDGMAWAEVSSLAFSFTVSRPDGGPRKARAELRLDGAAT